MNDEPPRLDHFLDAGCVLRRRAGVDDMEGVAVTEDEAKARWCPFSRVLIGKRSAHNRVESYTMSVGASWGIQSSSMCVGSQCMAWRSESYLREGETATRGWCGLAGRPSW